MWIISNSFEIQMSMLFFGPNMHFAKKTSENKFGQRFNREVEVEDLLNSDHL
jgi:hypothetical protein